MADRRLIRRMLTRPAPAVLFHATTPRKLARYVATGAILPPVRGFDTIEACRAWAREHGPRTIILRLQVAWPVHALPYHHRPEGAAWWTPADVTGWETEDEHGV